MVIKKLLFLLIAFLCFQKSINAMEPNNNPITHKLLNLVVGTGFLATGLFFGYFDLTCDEKTVPCDVNPTKIIYDSTLTGIGIGCIMKGLGIWQDRQPED